MTKKIILVSLSIMFLISCNNKEDKSQYNQVMYRAVHNKDTAILSMNINDKRFYGRYEISYYKTGKDSGDVRGDIKGDTLRGDFHYISNGGSWKRIPLALLKKRNKLYQGKGVIGTYFNLPCFLPDQPIEYDKSEFVFEEVKKFQVFFVSGFRLFCFEHNLTEKFAKFFFAKSARQYFAFIA